MPLVKEVHIGRWTITLTSHLDGTYSLSMKFKDVKKVYISCFKECSKKELTKMLKDYIRHEHHEKTKPEIITFNCRPLHIFNSGELILEIEQVERSEQ